MSTLKISLLWLDYSWLILSFKKWDIGIIILMDLIEKAKCI